MAEIKTKQTEASVEDFFNKIADENVRRDTRKIAELMQKATGEEPKMWGDSIVGFGFRHLKSAAGREVDWLIIGLSPRKQNITLYLSIGEAWNEDLLSRLGKHKTGKGCLYVKRLSDVDENVLQELIEQSAAANTEK
ncbi:MAG TPA: DUF1801 domain-containing protein [Pyrinomonadaceae bacterium]|jgi:hypothetical protein